MVEFLTLFLGLVAGTHPIELTVVEPVVAVEIRLDGQKVTRLEQPPWKTTIDLGLDLRPHLLTVIGLDANGLEIDRASQRLNLPRSPAELRAILKRDEAGRPIAVVVSWESLSGEPPTRLKAQLDGRPLPFSPDEPGATTSRSAALPSLNLAQLHFLSLEAEFPDRNLARSEFTFGGSYGSEVQTELTALLLSLPKKRRKLPEIDDLRGWILRDGQALDVVAVERGPADVVIVRDSAVDDLIAEWRAEGQRVRVPTRRGRFVAAPVTLDPEHLRWEMKLGTKDRIRFVWPAVQKVDHPRYALELFETSMAFTAEHGGLHWLLTRVPAPWWEAGQPNEAPPAQRLADAVAVAGLRAAAGHRRRAVVLVLGEETQDQSAHTPEVVRGYLAALGVPFRVWAEKGQRKGPREASWGASQQVENSAQLSQLVRDLRQDLDRQLVVWVAGEHLKSDLSLTAPEGVELAQ